VKTLVHAAKKKKLWNADASLELIKNQKMKMVTQTFKKYQYLCHVLVYVYYILMDARKKDVSLIQSR